MALKIAKVRAQIVVKGLVAGSGRLRRAESSPARVIVTDCPPISRGTGTGGISKVKSAQEAADVKRDRAMKRRCGIKQF